MKQLGFKRIAGSSSVDSPPIKPSYHKSSYGYKLNILKTNSQSHYVLGQNEKSLVNSIFFASVFHRAKTEFHLSIPSSS